MAPLPLGGAVQSLNSSTSTPQDAVEAFLREIERLKTNKRNLTENTQLLHQYILTIFLLYCRNLFVQHKQRKGKLRVAANQLSIALNKNMTSFAQLSMMMGNNAHIARAVIKAKFVESWFEMHSRRIENKLRASFFRRIMHVYWAFDHLVKNLDAKITEKLRLIDQELRIVEQKYEATVMKSAAKSAVDSACGGPKSETSSIQDIKQNMEDLRMQVDDSEVDKTVHMPSSGAGLQREPSLATTPPMKAMQQPFETLSQQVASAAGTRKQTKTNGIQCPEDIPPGSNILVLMAGDITELTKSATGYTTGHTPYTHAGMAHHCHYAGHSTHQCGLATIAPASSSHNGFWSGASASARGFNGQDPSGFNPVMVTHSQHIYGPYRRPQQRLRQVPPPVPQLPPVLQQAVPQQQQVQPQPQLKPQVLQQAVPPQLQPQVQQPQQAQLLQQQQQQQQQQHNLQYQQLQQQQQYQRQLQQQRQHQQSQQLYQQQLQQQQQQQQQQARPTHALNAAMRLEYPQLRCHSQQQCGSVMHETRRECSFQRIAPAVPAVPAVCQIAQFPVVTSTSLHNKQHPVHQHPIHQHYHQHHHYRAGVSRRPPVPSIPPPPPPVVNRHHHHHHKPQLYLQPQNVSSSSSSASSSLTSSATDPLSPLPYFAMKTTTGSATSLSRWPVVVNHVQVEPPKEQHHPAPKLEAIGDSADPTQRCTTQGNIKRFECHKCNAYWFDDKKAFDMHLRTHSIMQRTKQCEDPKRPWKCEICKRKFAEKCTLKRHIRIHTNEKPWKCSFCAKAFNQSCSLQAHVRIHTGERPFPCTFCEKKFRQSTHRRQHMKRVHKKQWEASDPKATSKHA